MSASKQAVPTQGTLDQPMMEFINDIASFTPDEILDRFYGVCNNTVGMARFNPKQAEAFVLGAEQLADLVIMSMPPWKVTNEFLIQLENMLNVVRMQVWRATTLDTRNERSHISESGSFTETRGPGVVAPPRKKMLGVF